MKFLTCPRFAVALMLAGFSFTGGLVAPALACPFCTAPQPTLCERREAANIVALGQKAGTEKSETIVHLHQVLEGKALLDDPSTLRLPLPALAENRGLVVLFGTRAMAGGEWQWESVPVDETSYAYFLHAPSLRIPTAKRLAYFIRYLESPTSQIAEDAYAEFGRAPYDAVEQVAAQLPMARMRAWLTAPEIPEQRKGLYGLLLGLAATPEDRAANRELFDREMTKPAVDFRAGFDGLLGGYLVLEGEPALELIERRILANPQAARGDVLHAMTALRFYREYRHRIPVARLAQALGRLLVRPEFAAAVLIDLARWQSWDYVPQAAALWGQAGIDRPTERAVISYLLLCPREEAAKELAVIRRKAPETVEQVERELAAARGDR